jgi:hypothetical protein
MATVKELRVMLFELAKQGHDDEEVQVWLPESYIRFGTASPVQGKILIEGSVKRDV